MLSRNKQFLKAASFTAAMMLADHCLFNNGVKHDHHDHHHHHHHHEDQPYIAAFIAKLLSASALALISTAINATRFGISSVSNNNNIVMGASELAIGYLSPGGNALIAATRGFFGAAMATGINSFASDDNVPEPKRGPGLG